MKSILRLSIIVFLAAVGVTLSAAGSAQIEAEMKRIEILNRALDDGGVPGMLAAGVPCPLMRSQYYADKIAAREPERRALELAKRDFGRKLAHSLDDWATQLQKRTNSAERAKQARLLLDLADWLKAASGYGNYFLFSRSESLAAVPLVYLTADLDYPLASIVTLRQRIAPTEAERAFRVTVLNDEAPNPFVGTLNGNDSERDDQMELAWNSGWHASSDWFKAHGVSRDAWQRTMLPEDMAFFLDDEFRPDPLTTVNTWRLKRHRALVFGNRDVMIRSLDEFMLYREKVGVFPTRPPSWWKPNPANSSDTALRVAFQEGSKHLRRENGQPFGYSAAAMLYQQVVDGKVMDYETSLVQSADKAKRTQNGQR